MFFFILLLTAVNSFKFNKNSISTRSITNTQRRPYLNIRASLLEDDKNGESKSVVPMLNRNEGQNKLKVNTGSDLNQMISNIFTDRAASPKDILRSLKTLVKENKYALNHIHAATMMQRCARSKIDITEALSLKFLADLLGKTSHRENLKPVEAAHTIYGLRMLHAEKADIFPFINLLTLLVSGCSEPFKAQEIGNTMYGLQKFSSDSTEIRKLLSVLAVKFKMSSTKGNKRLSPQEISNALFGLRKMTSDSPEVLIMLEVLTEKIYQCPEEFNSQSIGNSLNGLQGMSSEEPKVIELLRALIIKVAKSRAELSAYTMGSALAGLKSMDARTVEVRTLIALLALKIDASKAGLDPISFSSAMNGLRNFSEGTVEMRALLGTLTDKINQMPEKKFNPNVISNALYGLQKLTGESAEGRGVFAAILNKMDPVSPGQQYSSLDFGRALHGLQSLSVRTFPASGTIFKKLAEIMGDSEGPLFGRDAGLALYGLKEQSDEQVEVRILVEGISSRLSLSNDLLNAKSLSMAMMGLQGMSSESKVVCHLLSTLTPRMDTLDAQACGNILYSMKKMSSDQSEVRARVILYG
jgi:hypothetical protein